MAWGTGARERTSTSRHKRQRLRILARDDYRCQLRGSGCLGAATEMDHKTAVAYGGGDDDDNQHAVCHPCHVAKTNADKSAVRALSKYPASPHPGIK